MKKDQAITLHISAELMQLCQALAKRERRPVGQLLALWVEDVALVELAKVRQPARTYTREQPTDTAADFEPMRLHHPIS